MVTSFSVTGTVKTLVQPWTLALVLRRSKKTWSSDESRKSKVLDNGSEPTLKSLAPADVDKSRKVPAFAMAGERAKIGADPAGLDEPAGGCPARAAVATAAAVEAAVEAAVAAARSDCKVAICSCICCKRVSVDSSTSAIVAEGTRWWLRV